MLVAVDARTVAQLRGCRATVTTRRIVSECWGVISGPCSFGISAREKREHSAVGTRQHISLVAIVALLLCHGQSWSREAVPQAAGTSAAAGPGAQAMLDAVNAERSRRGLGRLAFEWRLARAAEVQARDLAAHGRFCHKGSDGSSVGDRAERAGYRWSRVGENLANTSPSASAGAVVRLWMNSPQHRANLLNAQFTQMGVARQGRICVLVLARPERGRSGAA